MHQGISTMPASHHSENASSAEDTVDLRSDTVTRPTMAMYERIRQAPLGDDGLDGDPSAIELEELAAKQLGKEAGLFVPTCTMANLLAIMAQTRRAEQVLLEQHSHIYNTENGPAILTDVILKPVAGSGGAMDLSLLEEALVFDRGLRSSLICMETSHNSAGGAVLPVSHMAAVQRLAQNHDLKVHVDGARFFNAVTALDESPSRLASYADTVSICLSKGLSAPAGAVLAGPKETIVYARKLRKVLGGTQRQIGILAAAGIEAIEVMQSRLGEDHARATRLSTTISKAQTSLGVSVPQTNIVMIDITRTGRTSGEWVSALAGIGILTRSMSSKVLRCVTHRHLDDADIDRAANGFISLVTGEAWPEPGRNLVESL